MILKALKPVLKDRKTQHNHTGCCTAPTNMDTGQTPRGRQRLPVPRSSKLSPPPRFPSAGRGMFVWQARERKERVSVRDISHTSLAGPIGRIGTGILPSPGWKPLVSFASTYQVLNDILNSPSNSHHALQLTLCRRSRLLAMDAGDSIARYLDHHNGTVAKSTRAGFACHSI
jgi:hypothetical protein